MTTEAPQETGLAKIRAHEAALIKLQPCLAYDLSTDPKLVERGRKDAKSGRCTVENVRKQLVADAVAWQRQVNTVAKDVADKFEAIEAHCERIEEQRKAIEAERLRQEAARKQAATEAARRDQVGNLFLSDAAVTRGRHLLAQLATASDEHWATVLTELAALDATIEAERKAAEEARVERERLAAEQAELRRQQEELRRQQAEAARLQQEEAARLQREREVIEAERRRIEAEERRKVEAAEAERRRIEAEERRKAEAAEAERRREEAARQVAVKPEPEQEQPFGNPEELPNRIASAMATVFWDKAMSFARETLPAELMGMTETALKELHTKHIKYIDANFRRMI